MKRSRLRGIVVVTTLALGISDVSQTQSNQAPERKTAVEEKAGEPTMARTR
jgi:hypothetical protein